MCDKIMSILFVGACRTMAREVERQLNTSSGQPPCKVFTAENAARAFGLLDVLDEPPEIVVTDVDLGFMSSGTEFIMELGHRNIYPKPVFVGYDSALSDSIMSEIKCYGEYLVRRPCSPGEVAIMIALAYDSLVSKRMSVAG
jgi:hypothetical protein